MLYTIAYPIVKVLLGVLFRFPLFVWIKIRGREKVPRKGGLLIICNHLSLADGPALWYACPRPAWYMGRADLFDIPLLGHFIQFGKSFPVKTRTPDRAALHEATRLLQAGEAVVMFPEGECSETGKLLPFLPGVTLLIRMADVPVLPVGLINTARIVPYGQLIPRPAFTTVEVRFGDVLHFDDLKGVKDAREIMLQRMMEAVAALTDQPVPELPISEAQMEETHAKDV